MADSRELVLSTRRNADEFGGSRCLIHKSFHMIRLPLSEKVTQRIDVIAESLGEFLTYRANLRNHWIFSCHGASSSSGVQTIGGS